MSIVLLGLFVVFNIFAIRFLLRWSWQASERLRDPERRNDDALTEYAQDEALRSLTSGLHTPNYQNQIQRLLAVVGILGSLLVADYHTIRKLWPWLLP